MKMKILLITSLLAAGAYTASAQAIDDQRAYGRIVAAPYFDISQRVLFSQSDYIYGTSRSAAMGGAFTSLGANLSSMNINPAGLGMYQSSDWGITQSISITSIATEAPRMAPGNFSSGGRRTSYGLDNLAVVFNGFNRSGSLTSLNFGFGYNRMANFNSRSFIRTQGESLSISDLFAEQLANMVRQGVPVSALASSSRPFENEDIFPGEWGSVLAYHSSFVTENANVFSPAPGNATTHSYMQSITKGGIYEYTFSMGLNVNNVFYAGATLGASQIYYKDALSYEETFEGLSGRMWHDQNTSISGVGYTMKLGIVARPVAPLRIGLAFHLPTFYTIDKTYRSGMSFARAANTGMIEDELRFNTAPRLLTGISYVIADRAIIALDYECAWFNKIRTRNTYLLKEKESEIESENLLKPQHSIRAGFEFLANDVVSVRLGGGYQTNIMREKDLYNTSTDHYWPGNTPTAYSGYNLSAGLGFNVGRNGYIDLTYMFKRSDYAKYDFYFLGLDGGEFIGQYDTVNGVATPREYNQTKNYHMISLTLGSRF